MRRVSRKKNKTRISHFNQVVDGNLHRLNELTFDRLIFSERFHLDQVVLNSQRDLGNLLVFLKRISAQSLVFKAGARLPEDILSLLPDPAQTKRALEKDNTARAFKIAIEAAEYAYRIKNIALCNGSIRYLPGENLIFSESMPHDLRAMNFSSATVSQDLGLKGKDCRKANFNAVVLDKKNGCSTVSLDAKTKLAGCKRNGMRWGEGTQLHYTHYFQEDPFNPNNITAWTFENSENLYAALEKAYHLKRKKEWFSWGNYFKTLNKKYGEANYNQKMIEVLAHIQEKPDSRTAKIFKKTITQYYKKEHKALDYRKVLHEAFNEKFSTQVLVDWAMLDEDDRPVFGKIVETPHFKDREAFRESVCKTLLRFDMDKINCVGDFVEASFSQLHSLRLGDNGLYDENINPALKYIQTIEFLRAKAQYLNSQKLDIAVGKVHIQTLLASIKVSELIEQYKAYTKYINEIDQLKASFDSLGALIAIDGFVSEESIESIDFEAFHSDELFLKNSPARKYLTQLVTNFINKSITAFGEFDWTYLESKKMVLTHVFFLITLADQYNISIKSSKFSRAIALSRDFLLSAFSMQSGSIVQHSIEESKKIKLAILFLSRFGSKADVALIRQKIFKLSLLLQEEVAFGRSLHEKKQRLTLFNDLIDKSDFSDLGVVALSPNALSRVKFNDRLDSRLAAFFSLLISGNHFSPSEAHDLARVDVNALQNHPDLVSDYQRLSWMQAANCPETEDVFKQQRYILLLIENGFLDEALVELNISDFKPGDYFSQNLALWIADICNDSGEFDQKKIQVIKRFLISPVCQKLSQDTDEIRQMIDVTKTGLRYVENKAPLFNSFKKILESFRGGKIFDAMSLAKTFKLVYQDSQLGQPFILTAAQKTMLLSLLSSTENYNSNKKSLFEIIEEIVGKSIVPPDLTNQSLVTANLVFMQAKMPVFFAYFNEHERQLAEAESMLVQFSCVSQNQLEQKIRAMHTDFYQQDEPLRHTFQNFFNDEEPDKFSKIFSQLATSNSLAPFIDAHDDVLLPGVMRLLQGDHGLSTFDLVFELLDGKFRAKNIQGAAESTYGFYLYFKGVVTLFKEKLPEAIVKGDVRRLLGGILSDFSEITTALTANRSRWRIDGFSALLTAIDQAKTVISDACLEKIPVSRSSFFSSVGIDQRVSFGRKGAVSEPFTP